MANIGGNYFRPAPLYESQASEKTAKAPFGARRNVSERAQIPHAGRV